MVYAGCVYAAQGHSPGSSYVVGRSPDGEVLWEHRADHCATALDSDGETVCVTVNSGALTALDAATGAVLRRTALAVGGPVLEYGRPAAAVVLFGDGPRVTGGSGPAPYTDGHGMPHQ
ncbi:hypothetical protein ACFV0H_03105 [Streptomyces erythrochromogenes]|uniref:hypothetical protein n=1 Tax=Streptomyces erythrochromogenes TaxID=285574 RepID=UPI0022551335|nr:hypothetical protein [Streptomyces erythrochromogenes]MCX5583653.1 hypothetical protein [Streptomyces erythrochromogenes]